MLLLLLTAKRPPASYYCSSSTCKLRLHLFFYCNTALRTSQAPVRKLSATAGLSFYYMEARISRAESVRISVVFSFNEARTPQELKKPPSYVLSYPTVAAASSFFPPYFPRRYCLRSSSTRKIHTAHENVFRIVLTLGLWKIGAVVSYFSRHE